MHTKTLLLTLGLAAFAPAYAQTAAPVSAQPQQVQPAGTISEVVVNGTTDLLANFVRATLSVQPGTPVAQVSTDQVRQSVLASGYFSAATVRVEQRSGRDVLVIDVTPNATIGSVEATGLTFLPAEAFKKSIADLLNIAPGATLNSARLEQARQALLDNYRSEGYPFEPKINVEAKAAQDGTYTVRFIVDETAPIRTVRIQGATLLPRDKVEMVFRPLQQAGKFTPEAYYRAVAQVQSLYEEAGYLHAGVEVARTTLQDGVLDIRIVEGRVLQLDTSNLGAVDASVMSALRTRTGQPLRVEDLQADVRTLSNRTGKPVGFALQANPQNLSEVVVYFGSANVVTAPIQRIEVTGNTLIPASDLRAVIGAKEGDVFSPQLAQEDFVKMRQLYRDRGYEISTRDAVQFENGVLTFNIREVKLAGYQLKWQGEHRTEDRVILRELPAAGQLFNAEQLRASLARISRLGYVQLVAQETLVDPQNPEAITYVLTVAESTDNLSKSLQLGLGYSSDLGWSGQAGLQFPNLFGLGHIGSLSLSAAQNDAGETWSGNASYTIPWLDLDFLDFREKRTSLTVSADSSVAGNQGIAKTETLDNGTTVSQDSGRDYTVRNNSFGVSVARQLTEALDARVGVGVTKKIYKLEDVRTDDKRTPYKVENGTQYWLTCAGTTTQVAATDKAAIELLQRPCETSAVSGEVPEESLTTSVSGALNYDTANSFAFPTQGVRANVNGSYSVGSVGDKPLGWAEVESGARTYFGVGKEIQKATGEVRPQGAFAVRANAGTTFGDAPDGTGFKIGGGSVPNFSRQIRGLDNGELFGTSYFTTSAEYRHDLGLNLGPVQGIYGVLFADAGSAWNDTEDFGLKYGLGAGVQVDLSNLGLALQFDYGYNPESKNGQFYFRLGNFW